MNVSCHGCLTTDPLSPFSAQLYELDSDPKRKEFLDDLFSFMQKRGEARRAVLARVCMRVGSPSLPRGVQ